MRRVVCWLLGHTWNYNGGDPLCVRCNQYSGEWRWALGTDRENEQEDEQPADELAERRRSRARKRASMGSMTAVAGAPHFGDLVHYATVAFG